MPLTPQQESQIRTWLGAGATIQVAHQRAKEAGWTCSAAKVGQLAREARLLRKEASSEAPAEAPADQGELALRLQRLEERLTALQQLPKEGLEEAAVGAVITARRISQDPGVDPRVQVQALQALPQLVRLAKEIREAANDGGGALWSPEEAQEASAPAQEATQTP